MNVAAFASGLLFGIGLVISGMGDPRKVHNFLDLFGGAWDASLMFVMMGAVGVYAIAHRWVLRRSGPLFAPSFDLPARRAIDLRLLLGAAIFGVGWGLSGYCPGPALVGLPSLGSGVIVFVLAMAAGTFVARKLATWRAQELAGSEAG